MQQSQRKRGGPARCEAGAGPSFCFHRKVSGGRLERSGIEVCLAGGVALSVTRGGAHLLRVGSVNLLLCSALQWIAHRILLGAPSVPVATRPEEKRVTPLPLGGLSE